MNWMRKFSDGYNHKYQTSPAYDCLPVQASRSAGCCRRPIAPLRTCARIPTQSLWSAAACKLDCFRERHIWFLSPMFCTKYVWEFPGRRATSRTSSTPYENTPTTSLLVLGFTTSWVRESWCKQSSVCNQAVTMTNSKDHSKLQANLMNGHYDTSTQISLPKLGHSKSVFLMVPSWNESVVRRYHDN